MSVTQQPPQTKPAPTKRRGKVEHIADADALADARVTGMPKVPSICGMTLLPAQHRYRIVKRDTAEIESQTRRTCKRCLALLDKWQRMEDKQITREMERQFKEASRA